jgi:formylglycine-generating enzyme required for sulfatase activity
MRRWRLALVGLLLSALGWPIVLRGAIFEMHNGEVIVGEVDALLTLETALGGDLEVPPQEIVSIEGDRFACTDGTVVRGRIVAQTLAINTSSGQVLQVPVAQLKTMRRGKDAMAMTSTPGSVFEMQSGEVIVGEYSTPLTIQLSFGGMLEVPLQELVLFADERLTLRDGSRLKGRFTPGTRITVTTRFGKLQLPSAEVKTIRAAQGVGPDGGQPGAERGQETSLGGLPPSMAALGNATFVNSIGMSFVRIPAGEFRMGSHQGDSDETPVHKVRISRPFYLGRYEVTQGQWQAVMGNNPSHFTGDPTLPVEQVSWEEVQGFVHTLNAKEGGTAYRLPTEAEWEYAARAGSRTPYSFGNDASMLGEYAWYGENAGGRTHPVGQHPPNAWGLYDMYGNVWEWVQDRYGPYDGEAVIDPQGPSEGSYRVYRGGGWGTFAENCRSSDRNYDASNNRLIGLGFRLLRSTQ